VVYSIGSRNDYGFEEMIHRVNPRCEIHTFDMGKPAHTPSYVTYHQVGLGSASQARRYKDLNRSSGKVLMTLPQMRAELGHVEIDVLKIDCDGCEFQTFEQVRTVCQ
jgi:hypothetical protein